MESFLFVTFLQPEKQIAWPFLDLIRFLKEMACSYENETLVSVDLTELGASIT